MRQEVTILCFFISLILLKPYDASAQISISGRVLNQTDNQPISNVNVFLSNATIGDKTSVDGTFTLDKVPPGKYDLVVSMVGFKTYSKSITVGTGYIKLPDIIISKKINQLHEVKITPLSNSLRDLYYSWFRNAFLGPTDLAKDCTILNPQILDFFFDQEKSELNASTSDFLEIKNDALGYKVKYLVSDFVMTNPGVSDTAKISYHGFVLFEELKGSPSKERQWKRARQEAYENSLMHFLRSLLLDRPEQEGFTMQQLSVYNNPEKPSDSLISAKIKFYRELKSKQDNSRDSLSYWIKKSKLKRLLLKLNTYALNIQEIVQNTDRPGIYSLSCDNDALYVTYNKYGHFDRRGVIKNVNDRYNNENTMISFNSSYAFFDSNGWIINPESITLSGVWSKSRVAGLLPSNYKESGNKNILSDMSSMVLTGISAKLDTFTTNHPTEKVYLHLDKSNYDMSDTVWYKAYTVAGQRHQFSALSGILYVELVSPADTVMSRQILQLSSGVAWGGLALPDKAQAGDYHIRAYTNWMRNAGAAYFYNQQIHIGGYERIPTGKALPNKPDVQFFPEGGELVYGLRSKVAVKAVNASGYGQDIKGSVADEKGNVVADFNTRHLGMGAFAFTPQNGKTYTAKITTGETAFAIPLPQPKQEGYTLGINISDPDSIFIKVAVNEPLFKQKQHSAFYITAQTSGKVYYATEGKLEDMVFTAAVDKKRFPTGNVQFTLFSEKGEPLNERTAFVLNDDTLKLNIDAVTSSTVRGKVKITLQAKNKDKQAIAGTFSVAVVNEGVVADDELSESNMLTKLLLISDLKGYIEQPNYYFIQPNEQTRADLDILMLTQGYQRFEWKAILGNTTPSIAYLPEAAFELTGSITTPGGKPVPNGKVSMIDIKDKLLLDTLTDTSGNFKFKGLDVPDSARVILSARKINKGNNVIINIKPADYPPVIAQKVPIVYNDLQADNPAVAAVSSTDRQQRIDFLNKKHQLKEVTIKAVKHFEREKPDLSNSDNLNGPGNADQVIMSDKIKDCVKLSDCLTGIIKGVIFKNGVAYNLRTHGMHGMSEMKIIIDGAMETGIELDDINPNIIKSIEVLASQANLMIYGYDIGGALVITTKRGGDKDFFNTELAPGTLKYTFNGFYKVKEFYSPKYDNPRNNTSIADLRSTIYWNPNIITDKDGSASFEYFNADTRGAYRVVVEGIDGDGNIGRQVYKYDVK